MLDTSHLPRLQNADIQIFTSFGDWQVWTKPRGASMCYMLLLGAGGGASGGTTTTGGGGGASGCQSALVIPAVFLPDRLFVRLGAGGAGGAHDASGSDGGISYVSTMADTTARNLYLIANGGNGGTNSSGGASTAASTLSNCPRGGMGIASFLASQAGTTQSANVTFPTTGLVVSGGPGGIGGTGNGQGILSIPMGNDPTGMTLSGSVAGAPGTGNFGDPSLIMWKPFLILTGGTSGGSGGAGTGGNGTTGSYGCGGGGGGRAATGTGGGGAAGGNGLAIIVSW